MHQVARKSDCYLIARIQYKKTKLVNVLNNKLESAQKSIIKGIGLRIFTKTGHTAFGSTDGLQDEKQVIQLLEKVVLSANKAQKLKFSANKEIFRLKPVKDIVIPKTEYNFDDIKLQQIKNSLVDLSRQTKKMGFIATENFFIIEEEMWRITRSDETDIIFKIPRSFLLNAFTYKEQGKQYEEALEWLAKVMRYYLTKISEKKSLSRQKICQKKCLD